jgi:hypothetical protein
MAAPCVGNRPSASHIVGMAEPELSDEETRTLIDYARRKFAEERWPVSPKLRAVRAIMEKLDPKPEPTPMPEPTKRVEPSWRMARKRRR